MSFWDELKSVLSSKTAQAIEDAIPTAAEAIADPASAVAIVGEFFLTEMQKLFGNTQSVAQSASSSASIASSAASTAATHVTNAQSAASQASEAATAAAQALQSAQQSQPASESSALAVSQDVAAVADAVMTSLNSKLAPLFDIASTLLNHYPTATSPEGAAVIAANTTVAQAAVNPSPQA